MENPGQGSDNSGKVSSKRTNDKREKKRKSSKQALMASIQNVLGKEVKAFH